MFGRKKKEPPGLRCSFCGKTQHQVRKLIAGPKVHICDECVEICVGIVAPERTDPTDRSLVRCSFCRNATPADQALTVPDRGVLCAACLDAIKAAMNR